MVNWGNIFKWGGITLIIFIIVGALAYSYFNLGEQKYTVGKNESVKLPECIDGIDNDENGLIDYGDTNKNDLNCSSPDDKWERDLSTFYWILGVIGAIIGAILITYIIMTWKKAERDYWNDPVAPDRGWLLSRSCIIDTYIHDITCKPYSLDEQDIMVPVDPFAIYELDRLPDVDQKSGERFQYSFFRVTNGRMVGEHVIVYSMSKGEEYLKGGNERIELNVSRNSWQKLSRTFHMSSPQDRRDRIVTWLGENATAEEMKELLLKSETLSPQSSPYDDMDDQEFQTNMREKAMASSYKKSNTQYNRGSKKPTIQYVPVAQGNATKGDDDEE